MRLLITGAAGSGTSTLAAALVEHWGGTALEADAFLWLPTDPPYSVQRAPGERRDLFTQALLAQTRCCVAGSVMGWGVDDLFDAIVFLQVETAARLRRLEAREMARFGQVNPAFLEWAAQYDDGPLQGRSLARHEAWLRTLACPVIRCVGDAPLADVLARVVAAVAALPSPVR